MKRMKNIAVCCVCSFVCLFCIESAWFLTASHLTQRKTHYNEYICSRTNEQCSCACVCSAQHCKNETMCAELIFAQFEINPLNVTNSHRNRLNFFIFLVENSQLLFFVLFCFFLTLFQSIELCYLFD